MGKNKVIVLAVLEGGMSQSEAAHRYGVSRCWVYELLRRYTRDGDTGQEPSNHAPQEILGEFTSDPTKDYQAKKKHPDPKTGV